MSASLPHPSTTLINVSEVMSLQASGAPLRIFDCSFDLMQPAAGAAQFAEEHIAGAVHADLDRHLSASHTPGAERASGGRHPLPSRASLAAWLSSVGVDNTTQVVVYDRQNMNYCGRLWWILKWLGHAPVAVLDGGFAAWKATGGAVATGPTAPVHSAVSTTTLVLQPPLIRLRTAAQVQQNLGSSHQHILDARAAARYRGETEPIDPVAGHIPGALNRPFASNLTADGRFKPAEVLRAEFCALLGQRAPADIVHQCGSGVSAVPNLLAMEVAGLGGSALFGGSWSEWIEDPSRPIARG
jgi:thiosulfate/3-mercaptopyruvate sulfurtransferase